MARGSVSRVLSVPDEPGRGDHSSRTIVADGLQRPTRATGPEQDPADQARAPPLFGLAPGGVCHAAPVAGRAVRSYRTLSPSRRRSGRDLLSVALSLTRQAGRRALPGTVVPWSPDFPRPRQSGDAAARPSGLCRHSAPRADAPAPFTGSRARRSPASRSCFRRACRHAPARQPAAPAPAASAPCRGWSTTAGHAGRPADRDGARPAPHRPDD